MRFLDAWAWKLEPSAFLDCYDHLYATAGASQHLQLDAGMDVDQSGETSWMEFVEFISAGNPVPGGVLLMGF